MPKLRADKDQVTKGALFLVMGSALTVGTWSIYTLLTDRFLAPQMVAVFGSIMFDAAALFFARLAQAYASSPDSGLVPRAAMLAMICTSSWVNWQHALIKHWGRVGCVVLAGAPIVAELAFELYHRWVHRESLRAQGRVAAALPVLGKWAWLMHPRLAWEVVDTTVEARLNSVSEAAQREARHPSEAPQSDEAPQPQEAPHGLIGLPEYVLRALSTAASAPAAAAPRAIEAAPAPTEAPREAACQTSEAPMTPPVAASPAPPTEGRPAAASVAASLQGATEELPDLTGLTASAAARLVREALPAATSTQISRHLAAQGITSTAKAVRTALSRTPKAEAPQPTRNGPYL